MRCLFKLFGRLLFESVFFIVVLGDIQSVVGLRSSMSVSGYSAGEDDGDRGTIQSERTGGASLFSNKSIANLSGYILSVILHKTDLLKPNIRILQPSVRIHVVGRNSVTIMLMLQIKTPETT